MSLVGCKQKELIPVLCCDCKKNFCLRHRHPADHQCDPVAIREARIPASFVASASSTFSAIKAKSIGFFQSSAVYDSNSSAGYSRKINGTTISEDEALARAIQASLDAERTPRPQSIAGGRTRTDAQAEEEDRQIARAIAATQRNSQQSKPENCSVS